MKYIPILIIITICCTTQTFAQEYSRDVVVTTDTTREFNNTRRNPLQVVDSYIKDGIEIRIFETPFQVARITSRKLDNLNGLYMEFYQPSNMPKVRGNYLENDEDGEWFYWNEHGKLTMKKIWNKGKLLKIVKYK